MVFTVHRPCHPCGSGPQGLTSCLLWNYRIYSTGETIVSAVKALVTAGVGGDLAARDCRDHHIPVVKRQGVVVVDGTPQEAKVLLLPGRHDQLDGAEASREVGRLILPGDCVV